MDELPEARKTYKVSAILIASLVLWGNNLRAGCNDDWLDIDEVQQSDGSALWATNLADYPITVSVRVAPRNAAASRSTVTATLQSGDSKRVMHLKDNLRRGSYRFVCDWTLGDKNAVHDDDQLYFFPYATDASYRILQSYGSRFSHVGLEEFAIDFKMDIGTPIHAARSGIIARVVESNSEGCWEDRCRRTANFVVVLHDDGTTGEYYHIDKNGALVEVGQRVVAGEKIALSGNTGHTTMPHLHFAVYKARPWGQTQSIRVRFLGESGIVSNPRAGRRYRAAKNSS